jgi:hypothetical protein
MDGAEFDSLVADIKSNGLREPIITHDDMILDGGNRYRACMAAEVAPHFMKFGGGNLVSYVLSANLHRRHLQPGQHAAIVASMQNWAEAQTHGGNRNSKVQSCTLKTAEDRATQSGASIRTQKSADKVAKADPELAKQVGLGEISLPKAVEKITGKRPGSKQKPEVAAHDYDPHEEELENAHDTVRELAAENEALKDRLAVELMPGCEEDKTAAITTIQELRARVVTLEAELDAVKASRDGFMREAGAMKQQLKMQRKEIEKLKGQNHG